MTMAPTPRPSFESADSFWDFERYVKFTARHVLDAKRDRFLRTVLATAVTRTIVVPKDTQLWRAQLGYGLEEESSLFKRRIAHSYERMVPQSLRAYEGRVNPKSIPCLYCSTDMETAIMEVRPWVGSCVSVAKFATLENLRLIHCARDTTPPETPPNRPVGFPEPPPEERENEVWFYINRAFSQPVTRADDVADYAPTQVLAEAFRNEGFDGIIYGSALGEGLTYVFFNLCIAECLSCELYEIEGMNLKYSKYFRWFG